MTGRLRFGPLGAFALLSALPILVLGVALMLHQRAQIRDEALSGARDAAVVAARVGIQPQLRRDDVQTGLSPAALTRVDALLHDRLADRIARVKVWGRGGTVVYSDDHRIVGRRFPISDELEEALGGEVASEVSDLTHSENTDDRRFGKLLEVYVPLRFGRDPRPAGAFELYTPYKPIAATIRRETREVALLVIAGLALLWGVLLRIALQTQRRLRRQATHDALTGLPNRVLFHDRVTRALLLARREQRHVAVLLVDLDDFKDVNDTLGHRVGDELLTQVGPRLEASLRASDSVARLGGDEFAILLPDVAGAEAARAVAAELASSIATTFSLDGVAVHVEASIGVAVSPEHGDSADLLLQRADVALYQAKGDRTGCALYDPGSDANSVDRLTLVGELREAIDGGQLALVYQPKLNPRSRTIEGVEALVRWHHPTRGVVAPGEFVPLAERTGLMPQLTSWVLTRAIAQAAHWRAAGRDLEIAVNISAGSLADEGLPKLVADRLRRSALPADRLVLEITETAVMHDPARARAVLTRLAATGVQFAVDDFGTGHSSLAYLKNLPISELKIDRSFVHGVDADTGNGAIVTAAIDLGRSLGLRVVAEGAETQAELAALADRRCELVQGFAISRPLSAAKLDVWLRAADRGGVFRTAAPQAPAEAV